MKNIVISFIVAVLFIASLGAGFVGGGGLSVFLGTQQRGWKSAGTVSDACSPGVDERTKTFLDETDKVVIQSIPSDASLARLRIIISGSGKGSVTEDPLDVWLGSTNVEGTQTDFKYTAELYITANGGEQYADSAGDEVFCDTIAVNTDEHSTVVGISDASATNIEIVEFDCRGEQYIAFSRSSVTANVDIEIEVKYF